MNVQSFLSIIIKWYIFFVLGLRHEKRSICWIWNKIFASIALYWLSISLHCGPYRAIWISMARALIISALYHHQPILFWFLIFKARYGTSCSWRMVLLFYTVSDHNFDAWFFWILLISLPFNVSRYHPSYIAITLYKTLLSETKANPDSLNARPQVWWLTFRYPKNNPQRKIFINLKNPQWINYI